jgi:Helix-turn-helix of DDE superfamily endonuclease
MQNYQNLKNNRKQFLAVTGLKLEVFEQLLTFFDLVWDDYITHFTVVGLQRRRPKKIRKDEAFSDSATMLIFILSYLKNNPLQETHASAFGMNQPQANNWIHLLKKVLRATLQKADCLPCRDVESLNKILHEGQEILVDASERPIPRPGDKDVQQEFYSGKKTPHNKKHIRNRPE